MPHFHRFPLAALLLLAASALAMDRSSASFPDCGAPAGTEELLDAEVVILGEFHGTRESPETLVAVACAMAAARPDERILIGLELPAAFNEAIEEGGDVESIVAKLRAHPFWTVPGDGRHSHAMLAMLDGLVRWTAREPRIRIVAIENAGFDDAGAAFFAAQMAAHDSDRAIVLTGNAHARRQPVRGREVRPFGQNLAEAGHDVRALRIETGEGEAWVCFNANECGPFQLPGRDRGATAFVELRPCATGECPFDGIVYLPRLTISFPVSS